MNPGTGILIQDQATRPREPTLRDQLSGPHATRIELRGRKMIRADLSGLDLTGRDFGGADLSHADLSGATCAHANFEGAILFGAKLADTEFLRAELRNANLETCDAHRASFCGADLRGASFFNATLTETSFVEADLSGADLRAATLTNARLRGADLSGADLTRAVLSGADLQGCCVRNTILAAVSLCDARLHGLRDHATATWIGADIRNVDFTGAWLVRRTIHDQNYLHEFRTRSKSNARIYWVWSVTSDCGRSLTRWLLWLGLIWVAFGWLYTTVNVDFGPSPSPLSALYFSMVTLTTLGFGDVVPVSAAAQVVVMLQVVLGYLGLGGLLAILANKMTRRAD